MKIKTPIILIFSLLTFFISCNKGDDPPSNFSIDPIVHLAGESLEVGIDSKVTYWKNGVKTILQEQGKSGFATSVFVKGENVYVGGIDITNNLNNGVTWKNSVIDKVIDEVKKIDRVLIGFSGEDMQILYSIGSQFVHLKNNSKQGSYNGFLLGSSVSGNDVFACGYKNDANENAYAVYWKNGVETQLTQPNTAEYSLATSIKNLNDKTYVSGLTNYNNPALADDAVYWENGIKMILPSAGDARAYRIFISGKDIYVAGYSSETVGGTLHATYWRNGEKIVLDNTSESSYLLDIAVSKSGKIFALGRKSSKAALWVDGKIDSEINGTKNYFIHSMFLEEEN